MGRRVSLHECRVGWLSANHFQHLVHSPSAMSTSFRHVFFVHSLQPFSRESEPNLRKLESDAGFALSPPLPTAPIPPHSMQRTHSSSSIASNLQPSPPPPEMSPTPLSSSLSSPPIQVWLTRVSPCAVAPWSMSCIRCKARKSESKRGLT